MPAVIRKTFSVPPLGCNCSIIGDPVTKQAIVVDPGGAHERILHEVQQLGLTVTHILHTHAHFDHLHRPSLRAIVQHARNRRGTPPTIVIPHHVFDLVSDLGFDDVVELDWWNSYRHRELTVTHVPSRHWGARVIRDSHRGYGGYVLRDNKHSIYHAGDTAYFSGFREIGQRLAPELALLPIGAYNPPSFRNVHTSPADATRAFLDLNSRWMVPMHYGTFRLSHEPMEEPLALLEKEAAAAGIQDRVLVMEEGVTKFF